MTIEDLNTKRTEIENQINDLLSWSDAIQSDPKVFDTVNKLKNRDITVYLAETVGILRQYGSLLDDIMRTTVIEWPPVVLPKK